MEDECIVCFTKVKCDYTPYIFDKKCECEYIIHDDCLKEWLSTSPTCPICRNILLKKPTPETADPESGNHPRV